MSSGYGFVAGVPATERNGQRRLSTCKRRSSEVLRMSAEDEVERMRRELEKLRNENESLKEVVGDETYEEIVGVNFLKHGEKSRFLPGVKLEREDHSPRLVPYVGYVSEATSEMVLTAAPRIKRLRAGAFSISAECALSNKVVGLPGSDLISGISDPVAIEAPIFPPEAEEMKGVPDSIIVVERDRNMWENGPANSYLWSTSNGLRLGWLRTPNPDAMSSCLGEVVTAFSKAKFVPEAEDQFEG